MPLQLNHVRSQFPSLQERYDGAPAVFCDSPGGSQIPESVVMAMQEYLGRFMANTGGQFATSIATDEVVAEAHRLAADFMHCAPQEVVFGANMTNLTYLISRSVGRTLSHGDEIIVSELDHEANIAPWLQMAEERNLVVHWARVDRETCTLNLTQLRSLIGRRTRLIAVGLASNFSGSINPVAQIAAWARAAGAMVYVDAVHYAPHGLLDVRALDCDFLVTSAYKHFGPHLGILYGKQRHLNRLPAYQVRAHDGSLPGKFEIGTSNFEALAGFCACIQYISSLAAGDPELLISASRRDMIVAALGLIREHERNLMNRFLEGLRNLAGYRLYGLASATDRVPTFALRREGTTPRQLAVHLAERNIFAWDGNFYALAVAEALGVEQSGGVLRIGFAHYNTEGEVDTVLEALDSVRPAE